MKTFKSYVVSEGYYNSLKQYMTGDGQLSSFGEYVVMQHGDVNLIKAYMKFYSLRPASHLTLFELSEGLGTELIESGCTIAEDALEYLLKQKKFLAISEYIRHNPLHSAGIYPKLEIMLLKHAPDWLIKQYIHLHCFYAEAQMELMSLYRRDLPNMTKYWINDFLEKYTPCVGACEKLVEFGNKDLIRKAFNKTAFHEYDRYPAAEIKLIELGDPDLFREYITKYDLFDEAVDALLVPGRDIMLVHYLTNHSLRKYECRVAMTQKKDPTMMRLTFQNVPLHHEGYYPDAEINMVRLGNKELIYEYIEKWNLYEEAAEELIKLQDFNLTKAYISKYSLSGAALLELAIQGNSELIALYCKKHGAIPLNKKPTAESLISHNYYCLGNGILFERNIKKLISSGKTELIAAYTSVPCNISLGNSEIMFLELGNDDIALAYIRQHGLRYESSMLWMFEHQKTDYIKAHMGKPLFGKALVKLVELNDDTLLKEYISRYPLRSQGYPAEAEVLFMRYKNTELVKSYITKHGLYDESVVELFKMKNKQLLEVLIAHHELGHVGTVQLLSSEMPDLILSYVKRHKIDPYFHDLAVRTRDETLIRFLMKDSSLSFRGFNELAVQGFFDIMKEHVKKYGFPVSELINCKTYFYPEKAEFDFIAYGDKNMIKTYISSYLLTPKGEDKLAALGDMQLVQFYLSCKQKIETENS